MGKKKLVRKPIWTKTLGRFTFEEYEDDFETVNYAIIYKYDDDKDYEGLVFGFDSWGMDREKITEEMSYEVCQYFLYEEKHFSSLSFASNVRRASRYFDEEE